MAKAATPAKPELPTPEPGQALATYARVYYDALVEHSTEEIDDATKQPVRVFTGKLVEVFQQLGISTIYYTQIRRLFLDEGCLEYLVRGTRSYPSVVVLHHPPPAIVKSVPKSLTGEDDAATMGEELEALKAKVKGLEAWREQAGGLNIGQAFADIEQRLAKVESQLTKAKNGRASGRSGTQTK